MRAKKKVKGISHEEVQKALQKFQERGGLITQLPDEIVGRNPVVGGKFAIYEPIADTSAGSEPVTG